MIFRSCVCHALACCALLASAACASDQRAADAVTVRDSAGIEIVESQQPAWRSGEGWQLSRRPTLQIGIEDGDTSYVLVRVVGATRLPDGGVAIADNGYNQLRFYDAAGRIRRFVGREGQGPGEFEYLRGLRRCGGDSIFAFDLNWQTKVYTPAGDLVREMRLHEPGEQRTPYALSCSRAGEFVITGWGAQTLERQVGLYRATAPVSVLDGSGAVIATLGEFPSSERVGAATGSSAPHPFGRSTSLAVAAGRVYVGTAYEFAVHVYEVGGNGAGGEARLVRIVRGPPVDLQIRGEHIARYRSDQLAGISAAQRPRMEQYLADLPMPDRFPAYAELQLDSREHLWVRRFPRPGETERIWSVFGPDGALLGDVRMPDDLTVLEIGDDHVLGVHRDDLGVQRVQLYTLQR